MLEFPGEGVKICGFLRFSAEICVLGFLCHLSSVPLSAPRFKEVTGGFQGTFGDCDGLHPDSHGLSMRCKDWGVSGDGSYRAKT